ncbi:MAG: phage terminase large subunit family protein [Rhodobacteraceae bacterium]|nr:phage terminase large subunit family protein [Paracoccaceae bacterium]
MSGHPSALKVMAARLAANVRPAEPMALSRWLSENLVLVDGPVAGNLWSVAGAPYLVEIADCLSDDHPCNFVTVRKSQQSGASILALGWCLYVAAVEPANMLYAVPGIEALRDLNSGKLQPLIDAWHKKTKRQVILPQTARSGAGSTTFEKVFAGGRLYLGNANAVMDLSSKTIKKGVRDEYSKWTDIPGYGDPGNLFFGRFTAFRRFKTFKILDISTPEIDTGDESGETEGHCRIDRRFKASDRRFWHCLCPECGQLFVHQADNLVIDAEHPHRSAYRCDCGHHISEAERIVAIDNGAWIATREDGDHPGFHIDAFISKMMSYEAIAEDTIAAKTETAKKDLWNLVYGLPRKPSGDAPDHEKLMLRREEWLKCGHVPPRGLILTAAADVQMRGIWLEIIAHGVNRETWVVDARYLDGDTDNHRNPVFDELRRRTIDATFPDAFGGKRKLDALAVDSGYRSNQVYAWVRENQRQHPDTGQDLILAIKGTPGWGKPAVGTPTLVDIDLGGRKVKQGCKVWGVGTWPLKSDFYSFLRQEGVKSGAARDPDGYCHFGMWVDEVYFKQLTGDRLEQVKVQGRVAGQKWVQIKNNHFHDCRIYNLAMAEYLGISTITPEQWRALALRRGLPADATEITLFARPSVAAGSESANSAVASADDPPAAEPSSPPANASDDAPPAATAPVNDGWIGRNTGGWLNR